MGAVRGEAKGEGSVDQVAPILTDDGRREVLQHLKEALEYAFGSRILCVLLKGSVCKKDFIPYFSDCDIHVFASSEVMAGERAPKLPYALRFQKAFGSIDPEAYGVSQFQVYIIDAKRYPPDWTPPLPGTYQVVMGCKQPLWPMPDARTLYSSARVFLDALPRQIETFTVRFLDKPHERLGGVVRLLWTLMKPAAYQSAVVLGEDPISVWCSPLQEILAVVEPKTGCNGWSQFVAGVQPWQQVRNDPGRLRQLFALGIQTLTHLIEWQKSN